MLNDSQKYILVVEKSADLREMILEELKSITPFVVLAHDYASSAAVLESHRVAAVVSDIDMDTQTCVSLIRHIREYNRDLPFVCLTAFGDDTLAGISVRNFGAVDFVEKPFFYEDFSRVVRESFRFGSELLDMEQTLKRFYNLEVAKTRSPAAVSAASTPPPG